MYWQCILFKQIEKNLLSFKDIRCNSDCLKNSKMVLKRYEETNLMLIWEKCHFIIQENIFLATEFHTRGLRLTKAKPKLLKNRLHQSQ